MARLALRGSNTGDDDRALEVLVATVLEICRQRPR